MKVLFDTSVIIAAVLPKHPSHTPCFAELQAAELNQIQGYLSTHSLAEVYSVMTRMPSQPRMSPQEAQSLLQRCLQYLEAVSLETVDYQAVIAQMAALNLRGGGIFDALIAQAALKVSADQLLTLNSSHFTRLGTVIAQMVRVPT
ncbi:VapC toxin family PIN domain ribonuclease [filamentous cyanobacterium CCP2]|nr:VapC toxin family PIN domain ribonuclease [filamentous cyanobacterium CCP2]